MTGSKIPCLAFGAQISIEDILGNAAALPGITILGLDNGVAPATPFWKSSNQTRGFETRGPNKGKQVSIKSINYNICNHQPWSASTLLNHSQSSPSIIIMEEHQISQRTKHNAWLQVLALKCLVYPSALLLMWSAVLGRTSIDQGRCLVQRTLRWRCPPGHACVVLRDAQGSR